MVKSRNVRTAPEVKWQSTGMSDEFDPYLQWLGIGLAERPIDHYRLLGIARFEVQPNTIASAADQRMMYVRSFQTGPRGAHTQKLLNELATARVCLLNPQTKATYDDFLQSNSFVSRRFPNFQPSRHREAYPEIHTGTMKHILESLLRLGPIQLCERISWKFLGRYLRRKAERVSTRGFVDVLFEARRLKLHMNSHKQAILDQAGQNSELISR